MRTYKHNEKYYRILGNGEHVEILQSDYEEERQMLDRISNH